MPQISAAGHALEYTEIPGAEPALVFLHEGLGSIRQWRDFPGRVAMATGRRTIVYDRYGYGNSDVLQEERVGTDFMHREALQSLPAVLKGLAIEKPVLIGHSDGASIALIHAGAHPARGVAAMAPHVFVEPFGLKSIRKANSQFETTDLPARLAKYHRDARKTFHLWADAWLDPAFEKWNIEASLPGIRCPVLAIQGEDDEYGSMAQLDAIRRQVSGPCELLKLEHCGHAPFKDQPEQVLKSMARFIGKIIAAGD